MDKERSPVDLKGLLCTLKASHGPDKFSYRPRPLMDLITALERPLMDQKRSLIDLKWPLIDLKRS